MQKSVYQVINPKLPSLKDMQILIIGVGGIGCQLLKLLAKYPLASLYIIDMDTIEVSNLNRQFLFKHQHRGHSKALTAKQAVLKINPQCPITALHLNIKQLPIDFFRRFTFLIMALDNIEARKYVNKIGVRLQIPIIDAGTLGYKGNVSSIIPSVSRCYNCEEKTSTQKVYPVCTIRNRPQKPIHCIVWAKLLFQVFFGPDNEENDLSDLKEFLKHQDDKQDNKKQVAEKIMWKLFQKDVEDLKDAKNDAEKQTAIIFAKSLKPLEQADFKILSESYNLDHFNNFQSKSSLQQNVLIFKQAFNRLSIRKLQQGFVVFQKDDDDIMHFISSASNIRMHCFSIPEQTFYQVKNMAGNIIPAIASTNSIVSAIQVIQIFKFYSQLKDKKVKEIQLKNIKGYFVQNLASKIIPSTLLPPVPQCQICSQDKQPVIAKLDFNKLKFGDLVQRLQQLLKTIPEQYKVQQFSINYGPSQIHNSEEPRQSVLSKKISEITGPSVMQAQFLLTDQGRSKRICSLWVIHQQNVDIELFDQNRLNLKDSKISNGGDKMQAEQSDDDIIIQVGPDMNKGQQSQQLVIIEVKKKVGSQMEPEQTDQVKKKMKID